MLEKEQTEKILTLEKHLDNLKLFYTIVDKINISFGTIDLNNFDALKRYCINAIKAVIEIEIDEIKEEINNELDK